MFFGRVILPEHSSCVLLVFLVLFGLPGAVTGLGLKAVLYACIGFGVSCFRACG